MNRATWSLALVLAGCATTKGSKSAAPAPAPVAPARAETPEEAAERIFLEESEALAAAEAAGKVDWAAVEAAMSKVLAASKRHATAFYNLGLAHQMQGKLQEAEGSYRQAIHLDGKLAAAQENLAAVVLAQGDARQATQLLRDLAARDAGSASARVSLAETTFAADELDRAAELAREGLARDPKNLGAYCVLARVAVKKKDPQLARLLVSQGMKVASGPKTACLHYVLGMVLLEEKQTAKALVELSRATEKDSGAILEARFRIAEISMGFKDFKRAIDTYSAITKIDASNVAAYVNLGAAYKGSGAFGEAEQAYLKAIEVAKDAPAPEAHFNLGVLYLKNLDRVDDARTHLKRYLELVNAPAKDPAYGWLQEIDQRKAMETEMKRMEEEERRQEEIDRKAAEEKARIEAEAAKKAEAEPSAPKQ